MTKILLSAAALIMLTSAAAIAQDAAPTTPDAPASSDAPAPPSNGGAGIREGNIAATGRTMPNVGASKGAGVTNLDKGIQARDNEISGSICKGC